MNVVSSIISFLLLDGCDVLMMSFERRNASIFKPALRYIAPTDCDITFLLMVKSAEPVYFSEMTKAGMPLRYREGPPFESWLYIIEIYCL